MIQRLLLALNHERARLPRVRCHQLPHIQVHPLQNQVHGGLMVKEALVLAEVTLQSQLRSLGEVESGIMTLERSLRRG